MADETRTLAFGVTFDMAATRTVSGQTVTLTAHRSYDEHPPHKHSNDYVCIVLAGGFGELQQGEWFERRPGYYFSHQAGETHHDRIGPTGAMCLNLHFAGDTGPRTTGPCTTAMRIATEQLAFAVTARSGDELLMAALAAEVLAEAGHRASEPDSGHDWLGRVVEAISDEPTRRWSLDELAAIAGRHRIHVAQTFRARTGMSLGAFQRRRRLLRLALALRRGDAPLAALADEFGYFDQPHMTGEFRAAFGTSPGRYRRDAH